jgi:hypothetical protein
MKQLRIEETPEMPTKWSTVKQWSIEYEYGCWMGNDGSCGEKLEYIGTGGAWKERRIAWMEVV